MIDAGGPCQVVPSGSCAPTDTFGFNHLTAGTGLAYDSSENTLYVADGADDVAVFGPPEPGAPSVDSESTSNIASTTATLNADVNPFDVQTTCTFQYISDAQFQSDGNTFGTGTQTANCTPSPLSPTGFSDVAASAASAVSRSTRPTTSERSRPMPMLRPAGLTGRLGSSPRSAQP